MTLLSLPARLAREALRMHTSRQVLQANPAVQQASHHVHFSFRHVEGQQPAAGQCGPSGSMTVQGQVPALSEGSAGAAARQDCQTAENAA